MDRLDQSPQIRAFTIEELLDQVQTGSIRIPAFQRGFRWKDGDRLALFDSIDRGFPLGGLLFWRSPAEADRVELGRFAIDAEARADALWVVDGQQRLATLADILLAESSNDPAERTIYFDLEERGFAYGTPMDKEPPRWIPLDRVFHSGRLLDWAREKGLSGQLLSAARDLARRLRWYQIPVYLIETPDVDVPLQIFERLNLTGVALTTAEVFDALHGSRNRSRPASLRQIATELENLRFGRIPEDLVLQALLALRRKDPLLDFRKQLNPEDVPLALADTASALRQTITFLKNAVEVPHIDLLPFPWLLAILALFFHEHRDPSPRVRQLLIRWFWREAIRGALDAGASLGRLLSAIRPRDEEASVQGLLAEGGEPPQGAFSLTPFDLRRAQTRLQLVALAALRPRHLDRRGEIEITTLCDQPGGPAVRIVPEDRAPEAMGLANRLLHPILEEGRLREHLIGCDDARVLQSHLVSWETLQALRDGDFARFLRLRETDLRNYLERFLDSQAEWRASDRDRPSLASLLVNDE